MHKFLAFCLAAAGLPLLQANAHEAPARVVVPVNGTTATMPAAARLNATVVIERRHRRSRIVRTVKYRHGRRIVTTRRVYY